MSKQSHQKPFIVKATLAGVLSGILLGVFMKGIERVTEVKVYTLLLNIDYIPIINRIAFPEIIEFLFHIIISILLSIILLMIIRYKRLNPKKVISFVLLVSIVVGLLLFPTTALSERTPDLASISALIYWLIGHALYGAVLGVLLRR